MEQDIIKKIQQFLKGDMFTQEGIDLFTTAEKVELFINNDNNYYQRFINLCGKRNLEFFKDNELHDYLVNNQNSISFDKSYFHLSRYIKNAYDVNLLLDKVQEYKFDDSSYFLEIVAQNINDSEFIYNEFQILRNRFRVDYNFLSTFTGMIARLDNDEYKLSFLKKPYFKLSKENRSRICCSLNSDQVKLDNISLVPFSYRSGFIATLKDDNLKLPFLRVVGYSRSTIIESLKSDDLKEKYLLKYWITLKDDDRSRILSTFKDKNRARMHFESLRRGGKKEYIVVSERVLNLEDVKKAIHSSKAAVSVLTRSEFYTPDAFIYLVSKLLPKHLKEYNSYDHLPEILQNIAMNYGIDEAKRVIDALFKKPFFFIIFDQLKGKMSYELVLHGLKYIKSPKKKIEIILDGRYQELYNKVNYKDEYLPLINELADYYKVPRERLITVIKKYDMSALKSLTKVNFYKFLNLDEETFNRYLELMDPSYADFNADSLNDLLNAFVQRSFASDHQEIMSIFHNFLDAINSQNKDNFLTLINTINNSIEIKKILNYVDVILNKQITQIQNKENKKEKDLNEIEKLQEQLKLLHQIYQNDNVDYDLFFNLLLTNNNMLNILHMVTDRYISFEKGEYSKVETGVQRLLVSKKIYNANQLIKYIFANNSEDTILSCFYSLLYYMLKRPLTDEERELFSNEELLKQLIAFKKNPRSVKEMPDTLSIRIFNNFLKENINIMSNYIFCNHEAIDYDSRIEEHNSNEDLLDVISEIDPEILKNGILKNPKVLELLKGFLSKYKMLGWGERLEAISDRANLITSSSIIAAFITYFEGVYNLVLDNKIKSLRNKYSDEKEEVIRKMAEEAITVTALLDASVAFAPNFKGYQKLFGREDFRILLTDPNPYKSQFSKKVKLDECARIYTEMYKRDTITVPPIDSDFKLRSGKAINIVVGNVTNPINLDYGERTEACMRMGGFAHTLFRFASLDKNGFHIRFSHPKTHELISRVTCFRNGNTLFLNQLRFSLSDEYSDNDVIEACRIIAHEMIEATRGSKYPIDNVVVSPGYIFEDKSYPETNLGVHNITKGLGRIYHDVGSSAILLASSKKDNSLVPVSLGPDKVEKYHPQRDKVELLMRDDLIEAVTRINTMNKLLDGESLEGLEVEENKDLLIGYVGEDFYCAITTDNKVIYQVMNARKKNPDTLKELKEALEYLELNRERLFEQAKIAA